MYNIIVCLISLYMFDTNFTYTLMYTSINFELSFARHPTYSMLQ